MFRTCLIPGPGDNLGWNWQLHNLICKKAVEKNSPVCSYSQHTGEEPGFHESKVLLKCQLRQNYGIRPNWRALETAWVRFLTSSLAKIL